MTDFGRFGYVAWLVIFVWVPLAVILPLNWRYYKKYRKVFVYCTIFSILFGLPWDFWAVDSGMWFYPNGHILGPRFLNLPIEEYLFLIFVPSLLVAVALLFRRMLNGAKPNG